MLASRWASAGFSEPNKMRYFCCSPRVQHGSLRQGSNTMNILRLSAVAALGFALLTGNALAQQQTVAPPSTGITPPIPLTPPQLPAPTAPQLLGSPGYATCIINCDTVAMNCQNSCVPVTGSVAAGPLAPAGVTSSCNLSCASQQLSCKQFCGPGATGGVR